MTGIWLFLAKCIILFYAIGIVLLLIAGIVKMAVEYAQDRGKEPEKEDPGKDRDRLSKRDIDNLKYAKGVLNDLHSGRKDGSIKSNGYSYDVEDLRASVRSIDRLLWETEREEKG